MISTWVDTWLTYLVYGWLHRPPWLWVMNGWTHLGDSKVVMAIGLAGTLEGVVAWTRRTRPTVPLVAWFGIPISAGITRWLKEVVGRPRPWEISQAFEAIPTGMGRSFPSGHATMAFALAAVLSLRWPKGRWIWFSLAAGVALSRIALGLHWVTDVAAGALIGWGSVLLLYRLEQFAVNRFNNNIKEGR